MVSPRYGQPWRSDLPGTRARRAYGLLGAAASRAERPRAGRPGSVAQPRSAPRSFTGAHSGPVPRMDPWNGSPGPISPARTTAPVNAER